MSIFQDRQNRGCMLFLSVFCAALVGVFLFAGQMQLRLFSSLMLQNEEMLASSLLEQGVSKEILAAAFSGGKTTEEGALFLRQIGHQEPVSWQLLPAVGQRAWEVRILTVGAALALGALLLFGMFRYMRAREALYEEAADVVERFFGGDFSKRLPGNQAGTIYRLFTSIDQLSVALQTKGETERRTKEFLKDTMSDISHQLKTPLAALNMYTEIISCEPENADVVKRFSERSMQSLKRMEELIQALLNMMRLDAGSIRFEKHLYPAAELLDRALQNLKIRAEQERKRLILEGDPEAQVFCDLEWTGEAVGNLVKNALDHTMENGTICIFWDSSPAVFRLSVKDDGCGIAPEDIHHIFKRFYRSGSLEDRQGAGLGLPLAKGIVEGQGGVLSVNSVPGEGADFQISIFAKTFLTES